MAKPTNGELAVMIQGLTQEMRDGNKHLADGLARVEVKQDQTNGRVRKLEQYKFVFAGALSVLYIIVVPLMVQWLSRLVFSSF